MGNRTEWTYEIMHLEQPVAMISSDGLCSIAAPSFLPYNLYLEQDDDISVRNQLEAARSFNHMNL